MARASAQGRQNGVRVARTVAGLTQAELADQLGVARQTVVAIEAGNYAPSVYLALSIAEVLGGSVEGLFGAEAQVVGTGRGNKREDRS